jgi:murein DD-endopeptidase MepM/ murein hydrolase activator NlpD
MQRPKTRSKVPDTRCSVLILLLAVGFLSGFGASPAARISPLGISSAMRSTPAFGSRRPTALEVWTAAQGAVDPVDDDYSNVLFAMPESAIDGLDPDGLVAEFSAVQIDSIPLQQTRRSAGLVMVSRGELVKGQTLSRALAEQGISQQSIQLLEREMRPVFSFRRARPGQRFRLSQSPQGEVLAFRYWTSPEESFHLFREGDRYVARSERVELTPRLARAEGVIQESLYLTLQELGEYPQLARGFVDLFAWDIDFSRQVRAGDRFLIFYERLHRIEEDGSEVYVRPGRILAARYRGMAGDYAAVYFEDDEGRGDYYRADGKSIVKQFLAAPLKHTRISSNFSSARRHPILKVTRPHLGIDYAAAEGTEVWAVADGTVIYRGWNGGFGNLVKVQHASSYVSYYAHLSRFSGGLHVGQRVKQKQTLGLVGSTGLATGPHVCFRVAKNGHYVNPLQLKIPAGATIGDAMWGEFRIVRDTLLSALEGDSLVATEEAL